MRSIFPILLLLVLTFVYVPGKYASIEVSHSHQVSGGHGHEHHQDDISHHPHDHEPLESPESPELPENGLPEGDSHSHSHFVALNGDTLFILASFSVFMLNSCDASHPIAIPISVPEKPWFSLIKPPQLG
jgi:hypothetical protein